MPTTLITGANRGIGLALAEKFKAEGHDVIATARAPDKASALKALGVEVLQLDVSDAASVAALVKSLNGRPIDYLINNAGLGDRAPIGSLDYARFAELMDVNVIAPVRILESLVPNLEAGKARVAAALSSQLGSIANTTAGFGLAYRTSKAALNMSLKAAAAELGPKGITLLTLHPGWVETDMGGPQAPVKPAASAAGLFKVITTAALSAELRFLDFEGRELPW